MTKEEAQQVWAAASEYRWRGFDHWWEETKMTTQTKDFKDDPIVNNNGLLDMLRERGYGAAKCSWGTEIKGEEHRETIEWIDISKPPESAGDFLILYKNGSGIEIASYSKSVFDFPDRRGWTRYNHYCGDKTTIRAEDITHWRPLPKGPKEGKENGGS